MHASHDLTFTQRSFLGNCTASWRSPCFRLCTRRSSEYRANTRQPALIVTTVTKEMPKSAVAKGPACFQNSLSDDRDNVQSVSSLIEPLSCAIYDCLKASDW